MSTQVLRAVTATKSVERILVVEDDRAVQKALRRLFEAEGFAVGGESDGKSALEAFRATVPSAIVLDLRLPAMSGRDVCREVKQQVPTLPIIILSATTDVTDKVLLLELGADDYVTKPFSPRELLARVRAAIRRTARNEIGERSEEHTSELQSRGHLVCRLLLEKKKKQRMASSDSLLVQALS